MAERTPTSFRLSPECRKMLRTLAERLGIRDAGIIELAVRRLYAQEMGAALIPQPANPADDKPPKKKPRK